MKQLIDLTTQVHIVNAGAGADTTTINHAVSSINGGDTTGTSDTFELLQQVLE